jgi:hypothetical protein
MVCATSLSEDIRIAVAETQQLMKVLYEHTLQEIAKIRGTGDVGGHR